MKRSIIFLILTIYGIFTLSFITNEKIFASLETPDERIQDNADNSNVIWVNVNGFISSATSEHITTAVEEATENKYGAIVLALDTPGGSLDSTFEIISIIQNSSVPVIGYVYPPGKSAWSAGTIILLATDYAAMAPFTTIGSAQPVIGNSPVNDTKIINALTEKISSLSQLHGRNVTQSIRFVTFNDNMNPEKALERNIIESIAASPEQLLVIADGKTVNTISGQKTLNTSGILIPHEPSLRVIVLDVIANPLVATTFLTIGFLALIYGLVSPGFGVEITGIVLMILGLAGQGFDINWAAFGLLAIGVGLLIYEIYSPGFGILGIGGIIILSIGTALMITQPVNPLLATQDHIFRLVILSIFVILVFALFFAFIIYKAWRVRSRKPLEFSLQSKEGFADDLLTQTGSGFIILGGEYWQARSFKEDIPKGAKVRVIKKQGEVLIVEQVEYQDPSDSSGLERKGDNNNNN